MTAEIVQMHPVPAKPQEPIRKDIVKLIAMDIGKEAAAHIETMYPDAITATSQSMLLSLRNRVYNEIMAALETTDEVEILARLERKKKWRRRHKAMCKMNRAGTAQRS